MTVRTSWGKWALPYLDLVCAIAAAGLWYTQGGAVWYTGDWPGPWPLLLLAVPWLLRLIVFGFSLRPSVFDVALILFLVSAGVGVWAAYDPGPALSKFWLIVGAVGLYYAVAHQPDMEHLRVTLAFFAVFGVVVSLYFFVTNDWDAHPIKVPVLAVVGKQISALLPSLASHRMSPNVVGGMLALVLPLIVSLIAQSRRMGLRWPVFVWAAAALVAGTGWLFGMSRGAWLALLGAACVWGLWRGIGWWVGRRDLGADRAWRLRLGVMAGLLLAGFIVLVVAASLVLAGRLPGTLVLANRLVLLRRSLLLGRDYAFTGAGLGMFQMHYSIYTLLIHVGYIVNSHNFLVDVLIEQGIGGLLAFGALAAAGFVYSLRRLRVATGAEAWVIEAGLAGLVVALAHGLVDDVLYGSRGVLLLFVPVGLIAAASGMRRESGVARAASAWRGWVWGAALALLLVSGIVWRRPLLGAWYADLGALEQARVELNIYDPEHFDDPTMDHVRRQEDLRGAIALLERAVQVDPANPTARQRLAAIDLSRGQYEAALAYMQAAWQAGHRDEVTRLLRGDALAAAGRVEEAAETVYGLEWAEGRLMFQGWYRYWLGQDYGRTADVCRVVLLLNPGSAWAVQQLAQAEARIENDK
jgi:tetratricopeptide (TPR) repeat protein